MKKIITVVFSDLDNKNMRLELDSSFSPKTFKAILDHLPVKAKINRWGDELYTDPTEIDVKEEESAKTEVNELDVAYWPEGKALCLFFGPTPISKDGKILAYSPGSPNQRQGNNNSGCTGLRAPIFQRTQKCCCDI